MEIVHFVYNLTISADFVVYRVRVEMFGLAFFVKWNDTYLGDKIYFWDVQDCQDFLFVGCYTQLKRHLILMA